MQPSLSKPVESAGLDAMDDEEKKLLQSMGWSCDSGVRKVIFPSFYFYFSKQSMESTTKKSPHCFAHLVNFSNIFDNHKILLF